MNKTLTAFFALACAALSTQAAPYTVKVNLSADEDGAMAYLIDYDNGAKIDSINVDEGVAFFSGDLAAPTVARIMIDGKRYGSFILEPGTTNITYNPFKVEGGELNARMDAFEKESARLAQEYRAATDDARRETVKGVFDALLNKTMMDNIENPIGYEIFMQEAYEMTPEQLTAFVAEHPSLNKYQRVQKLLQANERKAATSVGNKFTDFEIEYNGETHRLSDVVGKGDYVLVDFWASWCNPCIKQTAVIKDLYKDYKDKGLKVLGVAVWDEPEATKAAIEKHELPWSAWLNGQNVPTDAYGISGIPCIILFGPDGTILSRDKQDDALKADVAKYFE